MNRIVSMKILVVGIFFALSPLTATAGPAAPAVATPVVSAPSFDSGTSAGMVIQHSGGFQFGYNMSGTTVTGSGVIPDLPPGYTLVAGDTIGWPDLDGNGVTDIVIQHSSGFVKAFLMQDDGNFVSIMSEGAIPSVPAGYSVIGWPDLDGDGDTDMVIQHTGGFTFAYLMDGLSTTSSGAVPGLATSDGYTTIGFPNLDGLAGDDIVVRHSGGYTFAYLMDGLSITGMGALPSLATADGYSTIGFPDLDGVMGADIVLQHSGGFSVGYLLNGVTTTDSGQVPGLATSDGYTTIGFPDLDGASGSDIVVQHSGGYTVAYLMDGLTVSSSGPVPGLPAADYTTIGFPNLGGGSGADIVVQHTGGFTFAYLMSGLTTSSSAEIPGLPTSGGYVTVPWTKAW